MSSLFDKLFELLTMWYHYIVPWIVVGDDMCGLIRRFGKYHRLLAPGLNWKIPLVEMPMLASAALESDVLREQSLTTKDGVSVTLRAAFSYRVVDPKKYIIDCGNVQGILNDVGCTVVAEVVPEFNAAEVLGHEASTEFSSKLERRVRARAKRWGIEVDSFGIVERVKARAYRLITSQSGVQD